jgi:hypothetical protein
MRWLKATPFIFNAGADGVVVGKALPFFLFGLSPKNLCALCVSVRPLIFLARQSRNQNRIKQAE